MVAFDVYVGRITKSSIADVVDSFEEKKAHLLS
jgi:hypothetical protein